MYLLLATALSLAIIAVTVALTPLPGGEKGGWETGQESEGKTHPNTGGLFSVLR